MKFPPIRAYPKELVIGDEVYRIRFVRSFKDPDCVGECDPSDKEIRIKLGQGRKETFATIIHELLHAMEFESVGEMKHALVYKLEKAILQLLQINF